MQHMIKFNKLRKLYNMSSEFQVNVASIIIASITTTITLVSLIIFAILPAYKKNRYNKSFALMKEFLYKYQLLNPWANSHYKEDKKIIDAKIIEELMKQEILYYGIPNFNFYKLKSNNFDPLIFHDITLCDNFSIRDINNLYKFWKLFIKKIDNILDTLNKCQYIVKSNVSGCLQYNDIFHSKILKTSLSICPNFDKLKLQSSLLEIFGENDSRKIDIIEYASNFNNRKKYFEDLKSHEFYLNIQFKGKDCDRYIYNLQFVDGEIKNIFSYFHDECNLSNEDLIEHKKHIASIEQVFRTSSNKLFKKLGCV